MSDLSNSLKVIRLNQIINSAQRAVQEGRDGYEIWKALYVPPDLLHPTPDAAE